MTNDNTSLRHSRRLLALSLAALTVGACSDDSRSPLEPLPEGVTAPARAEAQAFEPSIDDAGERVIPVIDDIAVSLNLTGQLSTLRKALDRGDAREAREQVLRAQETLDRYRSRPETRAEGADLSAIELVLDRARMLLGMAEAK